MDLEQGISNTDVMCKIDKYELLTREDQDDVNQTAQKAFD